MPELGTATHHLTIPDSLEKTYVVFDCLLKAETAKAGHAIQCPECSVVPSNYPHNTSFEQWAAFKIETYCEAPQQVANETLEVLGKEAPWREVTDLWSWDGKEATVHYFLSGVPTGLGPWFCFQAFCEADVVDTYRPIFREIWQSLTWNGEMPADPEGPATDMLATLPGGDEEPSVELELPPFAPPAQGPGIARFDDREVSLSLDHCAAVIPEAFHELSLNLRLKPEEARAFHEDVVSEFASEDSFGFRFTFSGIHEDGVPTGEFSFEEGKSKDSRARFWLDGWEYSFEFTGKLVLRDGWFGVLGFLEKPYDDHHRFRIEAYLKMDLASLDWSHYRFLSLQETNGAAPEQVRFLQVSEPGPLPDQLFSFKNLRELSLHPSYPHGRSEEQQAPTELDPRIGELSELAVFSLSNRAVAELPPSIGKLLKLQRVSVVGADLEATPTELWQLPALESLCLSHNKLASIPDDIQLPSLRYLALEKNSLSTLPTSLLKAPNLKRLLLEDNPWNSLDQGFLDIEDLRLEQADRMRLFDYSYPGANGSGVVEWDDSVFKLTADVELQKEFEKKVLSCGHGKYLTPLMACARKSVKFTLAEEDDYSQLGRTRFGGMPDLPESLDYPFYDSDGSPCAYEFVAQLNCQELAPFQDYLPRSGILYFFIDHQESFGPKVLYFDGPSSALISGSKFDPEQYPLFDEYTDRTEPHRVNIEKSWSLPSDYAGYCNGYYFPKEAQIFLEHDDLLHDMTEELVDSESHRRHEINGHVFTQHEGPELQAAMAKRGQPEEWITLLKVASIGGFCWWDAGDLFYVIHKSDLKKGDFSNVYCGMESS